MQQSSKSTTGIMDTPLYPTPTSIDWGIGGVRRHHQQARAALFQGSWNISIMHCNEGMELADGAGMRSSGRGANVLELRALVEDLWDIASRANGALERKRREGLGHNMQACIADIREERLQFERGGEEKRNKAKRTKGLFKSIFDRLIGRSGTGDSVA
ncbi:hypothetical protein PWT90_03562 [Aphanocladium album]|nr:hypothetical protein PWT90_03562 [Aphanocladium album]